MGIGTASCSSLLEASSMHFIGVGGTGRIAVVIFSRGIKSGIAVVDNR